MVLYFNFLLLNVNEIIKNRDKSLVKLEVSIFFILQLIYHFYSQIDIHLVENKIIYFLTRKYVSSGDSREYNKWYHISLFVILETNV